MTFLFILAASLCSCQKAPVNGALDGQWEVTDVEPAPPFKPITETLYYNFYGKVCMLSYYGGTFGFANMVYNGDTMTLDFREEAPEGDLSLLYQYGILSNPVTFDVFFKDSHHLILSNSESTIFLTKH